MTKKLGLIVVVSIFIPSCALTQTGFYTYGIYFLESNYCKVNKCKLIKRTTIKANYIEKYVTKTLGNLYQIEYFVVNNEGSFIFSRQKLSKPNTVFIRNVKLFLKSAISTEASNKFSASQCKTTDEYIQFYNQTGIDIPNQGLIVKSNGYKIAINCLIAPLTDIIALSERYKYPMVTITVEGL